MKPTINSLKFYLPKFCVGLIRQSFSPSNFCSIQYVATPHLSILCILNFMSLCAALLGSQDQQHRYDRTVAYICIIVNFIIQSVFAAVETLVAVCIYVCANTCMRACLHVSVYLHVYVIKYIVF